MTEEEKEEEKKNQVTFPKASVFGTEVCPSLLVPTGVKTVNQPSRVSSLQPVPLS